MSTYQLNYNAKWIYCRDFLLGTRFRLSLSEHEARMGRLCYLLNDTSSNDGRGEFTVSKPGCEAIAIWRTATIQ